MGFIKKWEYIVSGILLIIYFLRGLYPEIFVFCMSDIYRDNTSLFLITLALIFALTRNIYKAIIKFKRKRQVARCIAVAICLGIIFSKMYYPSLIFDGTSFKILVIVIFLFIIPDFKDIIDRIQKIKKGDFELLLSNLQEKAEVAENEVENEKEANNKIIYSGISDDLKNKVIEMSADPRGMLIILSIEIETKVRNLADMVGAADKNRPRSIMQMLRYLADNNLINREIMPVFRDFWLIRNRIIHEGYKLDDERLYSLVELGLRIIRLLPDKIVNDSSELQASVTVVNSGE